MTPSVVGSWIVLLAVWRASFYILRAKSLDATQLFLMLFGLLIVFRSGVLALGIDEPFPTEHFADQRSTDQALVTLNLITTSWLVLTWLGFWFVSGLPHVPVPLPFKAGSTISLETHRWLTWGLSGISAVVLAWIVMRSGSLAAAINAQKFERSAGTSLRLRSLGTVTSSISMAYLLRLALLDRRTLLSMRSLPAFVGLAVGATTAFAWGARDGAAFPILAGVLFWMTNNRRGALLRRSRRWRRTAFGGAGLVALVVGLRFVRDQLVKGSLESSLDGAALVRQVSVAANLTQFDAALLSVRDVPNRFPHRGGGALFEGFLNYVPVSFGGNVDQVPNAAIQLAANYEPNRVNGWPMTAVGEWWIASGWSGIVAGGLVCGAVLWYLKTHYRDSATDPLRLMILVLLTVVVFQFGIRGVTFSRVVSIVMPLLLIEVAARSRFGAGGTSSARTMNDAEHERVRT